MKNAVIKPRCPRCDSPYLRDICPCFEGRPGARLECWCGNLAAEVYVEETDEWPICASCLEILGDGIAPLPLPVFYENETIEEPNSRDAQRGSLFSMSSPVSGIVHPFGLTRRELEIARLVHLSNQEIADRLCISPLTVKTHITNIMRKLGVRSRQYIPYAIKDGVENLRAQNIPSFAWISQLAGKQLTFTLTISGPVEQLEDVLDLIKQKDKGDS